MKALALTDDAALVTILAVGNDMVVDAFAPPVVVVLPPVVAPDMVMLAHAILTVLFKCMTTERPPIYAGVLLSVEM